MYTTQLTIKRDGRAFVVDLTNAKPRLPTTKKWPHMTLLFCRQNFPIGTQTRLNTLAAQRGIVSFDLEPWGEKSDLIKGELYDFFQEVKKEFPDLASDRKPHVELRRLRW